MNEYTLQTKINDQTGGIVLPFEARSIRLTNDGGNPNGPFYYTLASSAASTGKCQLSTGETVTVEGHAVKTMGFYSTATSSGPMLRLCAWSGF